MHTYESHDLIGTPRVLMMHRCEVRAGMGSEHYHAELHFQIAGLTSESAREPHSLRWPDFANNLSVEGLHFQIWNTSQFELRTYTLAEPKFFMGSTYSGIDLRRADSMSKALRAIQARQNLIASRSGYSANIVENLRRQVSAFGVEELWIPHDVHFHNFQRRSHLVINLKKEPEKLELLLDWVSERLGKHSTFTWNRAEWIRFAEFASLELEA